MFETLAASVVAFLIPYVKKGAEKIAEKVGKKAEEKMGELLETLKNRLSGDREASDQLGYFEKDPDTYKPVLEKILQRRMNQDKTLADELEKLVKEIKEAAPNLEVFIKMDDAENVTGIEADELTGRAKAELDIKKGKNVTGAKIKRIGPQK